MGETRIPDSPEPRRRSYDLAGAGADYPDREGPPQRTLLIFTQQRSGSTLLGEALYFAGGLGCPLEYFHGGFRPDISARWNAADLDSYVAALWRRRTDPSGTFAVKLFWSDVEALARELAPGRYDWLGQATAAQVDDSTYRELHALIAPILPNPMHVRLRREDGIAQAVSNSVAIQRKRWRRIDASDPAHSREVEFRFHGIALALSRIQNHDAHWDRYCVANGIAPYRLSYEALAADYAGEVRRLLDALGHSDAPVVPPRMQKQADARSEELADAFRQRFWSLTRGVVTRG